MIGQGVVQEIEAAIDELAWDFQQAPGLLLTEADVKSQLMARIQQIGSLGQPSPSADNGVLATAVHAEVPWFDERGQLKLRPDITITEPRHLSIHRAMQRGILLPHKGFHFVGASILIELKFYRGRTGIRPRSLPPIRKDIQKLKRLIRRGQTLSPETFMRGIVVVFAKYSYVCSGLRSLAAATSENVRVMVRAAGVEPHPAVRRPTSHINLRPNLSRPLLARSATHRSRCSTGVIADADAPGSGVRFGLFTEGEVHEAKTRSAEGLVGLDACE